MWSLQLVLAGVAFALNPVQRIQKDFRALTVRASPRHIMRPKTERGRMECAAIAKDMRSATARGEFVVDAFAAAAAAYSTDADTSSRGGLLGDMIPQGTIRSKALDRACFTANLGEVEGPIETEFGWHLVLVGERINCGTSASIDSFRHSSDRVVRRQQGPRLRPNRTAACGRALVRPSLCQGGKYGDSHAERSSRKDGPDHKLLRSLLWLHRGRRCSRRQRHRDRGSRFHRRAMRMFDFDQPDPRSRVRAFSGLSQVRSAGGACYTRGDASHPPARMRGLEGSLGCRLSLESWF